MFKKKTTKELLGEKPSVAPKERKEKREKKQIATITLLADQKQGLALAGLNATSEIHLATSP